MKNCLFSAENGLLTALRNGDDVRSHDQENLDEKQEMMGGQFTDYSVTKP